METSADSNHHAVLSYANRGHPTLMNEVSDDVSVQ